VSLRMVQALMTGSWFVVEQAAAAGSLEKALVDLVGSLDSKKAT
jgi:hypothetical protein